MSNHIIKAASSGVSPFDSIRRVEKDTEFWLATELLEMLGYQSWKRIKDTVERAILACNNSGQNIELHMDNVVQIQQIGDKGGKKEIIKDYAIDKLIEGLQDLKLLLGNKEQVDRIEQRLDHHESEIGRIFKPDGQYFSIRGWANRQNIKVNVQQAKAYGHVAGRLSKKLGIPTDKLPDPRYGKVNAYHESVLVQIF